MTGDASLTPVLQNAVIKGRLEDALDEETNNSSQDCLLKTSGLFPNVLPNGKSATSQQKEKSREVNCC